MKYLVDPQGSVTLSSCFCNTFTNDCKCQGENICSPVCQPVLCVQGNTPKPKPPTCPSNCGGRCYRAVPYNKLEEE
ncbi:Uncharacterised protein [Chlamydia trachomatis]|nr:Uncharacterised protein [Chlamydia trachomatis]